MTTVAAKPAERGSWWLVLLGGLTGQAARVAEADRERAALLAAVSRRAPQHPANTGRATGQVSQ